LDILQFELNIIVMTNKGDVCLIAGEEIQFNERFKEDIKLNVK